MVKAQGQIQEIVQKYLGSTNTKGALDNGLQSDSEKTPQRHLGSPPDKPPGISQVSQCRKKLKLSCKSV